MRVAYDDTLRARLIGDTLTSLTVIDRYNLVDDAWNAVIGGRYALRACIVNVHTTAGDVTEVPEIVAELGRARKRSSDR